MKTVAIFGVGLIGGSFALALRKAGFTGTILGVSSPATIRRALELRVIDSGATAREAAEAADLVYLAQPILQIIDCMPELGKYVRNDAIVTDAGSTKSAIVQAAAESITRCQFLGGHPMAGRERRGVEAAEEDLFRGRPYVLAPRDAAELETPAAREFAGWVDKIGAVRIVLEAGQHDRIVAYTSHLVQLASTALAATLQERPEAGANVFGPGLIEHTRLALSSYDLWGDILATNQGPILEALDRYIATLQEFRDDLTPNHMRGEFDRAARFAAFVRNAPG